MVANPKTRFITPEEYLERESAAETKSEYYNGLILAMSGGSLAHNGITTNISARLYMQLLDKPCRPLARDMRVRVPACNCYFYPDVIVVCGEPEIEIAAGVETLKNPRVVVEVLSPSTENVDRGEKLICYQSLESLSAYLLVSQDRPMVQVYERQEDGRWLHGTYRGLESIIPLPSIGCQLRLDEAYSHVNFPVVEEPQAINESASH